MQTPCATATAPTGSRQDADSHRATALPPLQIREPYKHLTKKSKTMSSKRDLKRAIHTVCTELFAECVATSLYGAEKDKEMIDTIFKSVISVHADFIRRVSFPEPGIAAKKYYKFTIDEFNKQVGEIIDQLNNLH